MSKKVSFATISVLSFIVSASFTIALFTSNSLTKGAMLLMIMTALAFEMAKWVLLWEGFSGKHESGLSAVLIGLWVAVTVGSIVASCGYVLNENNKSQNNSAISSTQYKQAEQGRNILIDTYNAKVKEIEQLRKQAEELPKNYITVKQNIMAQVDKKSTELSNLTSDINKPININADLPSNGYTAFFVMVGEIIGEDAKNISLWLFLMLGVVLELIGNVFAYLYQKESNHVSLTTTNFTPPTTKIKVPEKEHTESPKPRIIQGGRLKGMKFKVKPNIKSNIIPFETFVHVDKNPVTLSTSSFTKDEVDDYVKCMYETKTASGDSRGFKTIAKDIGIDVKKAEKIKAHLEMIGVVKVVGNRTRIIKEVV